MRQAVCVFIILIPKLRRDAGAWEPEKTAAFGKRRGGCIKRSPYPSTSICLRGVGLAAAGNTHTGQAEGQQREGGGFGNCAAAGYVIGEIVHDPRINSSLVNFQLINAAPVQLDPSWTTAVNRLITILKQSLHRH
ncbi:hypothetical protein [Chromatium okenii]|uniref:hypothetical protein n=1 Tax=Chromatium okenii TaxID=61644 RepID=UPI001F5B0F9A|nr:hypothetical protein [Chromatium okenii]